MNFLIDIYSKIKLLINLIMKRKYFFLLPIIIIFSSLKIYGYVFFFFLCIPYIYNHKNEIISEIKNCSKNQKLVFFYLLFLIIQIIYGSLFLKDERVLIFWIPFIIALGGSYFKNIYDLKYDSFYRKNYLKIIFISSNIYFIFYFVLNIFAYIFSEGFYSIQDNFWIGSSSAFSLTSLLFYSMYSLWEKKQFKIFSYFTLSLVFYILVLYINETRLGLFYLCIFTFFVSLRCLQLRKFINCALLIIIVLSTYNLSSLSITSFHNNVGMKIIPSKKENVITNYNEKTTIINDSVGILQYNDDRQNELLKGYEKFQEYPLINKFIGTGWYSSRITRNLNKIEISNLKLNHRSKKATYLQAIVALTLDTGLIGILFLGKLYLINSLLIWKRKDSELNKLFYIFMLFANFLCLFIGYPIVNIPFLLFIFPDGIINLNYDKTRDKFE